MKLLKLLTIPVVLVLTACSTTYEPTAVHSMTYNFDTIKTFNVVGDDHLRNPMISDINRDRIDSAVTKALTEEGIKQVKQEKADVLISYFIVTKDKVKVNSSYGAGYGRYGAYGYDGVSHIDVRDYVEGTLVIDMIDNDTKQSIWRSTLTKSLKSYDTAEERNEAINKAVNSMMKTLPTQEQVS